MNSPRLDVIQKSVQELEYQAEVAEWIGADVINIHEGDAVRSSKSEQYGLKRTDSRLLSARLSLLRVGKPHDECFDAATVSDRGTQRGQSLPNHRRNLGSRTDQAV